MYVFLNNKRRTLKKRTRKKNGKILNIKWSWRFDVFGNSYRRDEKAIKTNNVLYCVNETQFAIFEAIRRRKECFSWVDQSESFRWELYLFKRETGKKTLT